jgi:hypothetical protein
MSELVTRLARSLRYIRIDAIVEDFGAYEQDHVPNANTDESRISSAVQRLVRLSVDLRRDDTGCLHRHIVQCRSDRACADCACVTTCDGYQDGVDVWIADDERCYGVPGPVRRALWDGNEGDE